MPYKLSPKQLRAIHAKRRQRQFVRITVPVENIKEWKKEHGI